MVCGRKLPVKVQTVLEAEFFSTVNWPLLAYSFSNSPFHPLYMTEIKEPLSLSVSGIFSHVISVTWVLVHLFVKIQRVRSSLSPQ